MGTTFLKLDVCYSTVGRSSRATVTTVPRERSDEGDSDMRSLMQSSIVQYARSQLHELHVNQLTISIRVC